MSYLPDLRRLPTSIPIISNKKIAADRSRTEIDQTTSRKYTEHTDTKIVYRIAQAGAVRCRRRAKNSHQRHIGPRITSLNTTTEQCVNIKGQIRGKGFFRSFPTNKDENKD